MSREDAAPAMIAIACIAGAIMASGLLARTPTRFVRECSEQCEATGQVLHRAEVRSQGGSTCACAPRVGR